METISTVIGIIILTVLLIGWLMSALNPLKKLSLNQQEDRVVLGVLYVLARDIIHADGQEEKRELDMVVTLVQEILDQPNMDREFILSEYRLYGQQKLKEEDIKGLSLHYRKSLLHCLVRIARSDLKIPDEEMNKLHEAAKKLDLPEEEVFNAFERSADINREEFKRSFRDAPNRNLREWACDTLKCSQDASQAQIKEAYEREANASLPSRASAEDKEKAKTRFKEVREAYNILRKRDPDDEE